MSTPVRNRALLLIGCALFACSAHATFIGDDITGTFNFGTGGNQFSPSVTTIGSGTEYYAEIDSAYVASTGDPDDLVACYLNVGSSWLGFEFTHLLSGTQTTLMDFDVTLTGFDWLGTENLVIAGLSGDPLDGVTWTTAAHSIFFHFDDLYIDEAEYLDLRIEMAEATESPVPEPASATLFGLGLSLLAARRMRKRQSA